MSFFEALFVKPLLIPINHQIGFWVCGWLLGVYYGIRGIVIKIHEVKTENKGNRVKWGQCEMIFVHCIQDFILNLIGCLAGFASLYMVAKIIASIQVLANIQPTAGVMLGLLSLAAIIGIGGFFPPMLFHLFIVGKAFGKGK